MGHRVPNHKSKCKNLHGHRYKIEVGVNDKVIDKVGSSEEGMVIDFGDLKDILMKNIDAIFDHALVLDQTDKFAQEIKSFDLKTILVDFVPTAENLARYWYDILKPALQRRNIKIKHVRVWETPTSTATYEED